MIKGKFKLPGTCVILIFIVILAGFATHFVPAGSFDRALDPATGRELVVPNSYHRVENAALNPFDVITAIPAGLAETGYLTALTVIAGGAINIIESTGAFAAALGALVGSDLPNKYNKRKRKFSKSKFVVVAIMSLMAMLAFAYGAAESLLPFVPIVATACYAMGYDSLTAMAIVMLSCTAGFAGTAINPTSIGIAQSIAGLPYTSGMGLRVVAFLCFFGTAIVYVLRHIDKQKDNDDNVLYNVELKSSSDEIVELTPRRKLVALVFLLGLVLMVYLITKFKFSTNQIAAYYFILAIVCGIIAKMKISEMEACFLEGARNMVFCALVMGFARGISIVMAEGNILDTISYNAALLVKNMPGYLHSVGMFIVQDVLNILIPSSSGQAAATMPIMIPIADLIGMSRQTACLAYQFGDALTNMITPAAGFMMAGLAMLNIEYEKWIKFFIPLYVVWFIIACVFLVFASIHGYGPF